MTSQFASVEHCLAIIAGATGIPLHDVQTAWEGRQPIHIGFPQDLDAEKFSVQGHDFAINPFRDGDYNVWSIASSGVMARW